MQPDRILFCRAVAAMSVTALLASSASWIASPPALWITAECLTNCGTASKGISLLSNGSGSAGKGSVHTLPSAARKVPVTSMHVTGMHVVLCTSSCVLAGRELGWRPFSAGDETGSEHTCFLAMNRNAQPTSAPCRLSFSLKSSCVTWAWRRKALFQSKNASLPFLGVLLSHLPHRVRDLRQVGLLPSRVGQLCCHWSGYGPQCNHPAQGLACGLGSGVLGVRSRTATIQSGCTIGRWSTCSTPPGTQSQQTSSYKTTRVVC